METLFFQHNFKKWLLHIYILSGFCCYWNTMLLTLSCFCTLSRFAKICIKPCIRKYDKQNWVLHTLMYIKHNIRTSFVPVLSEGISSHNYWPFPLNWSILNCPMVPRLVQGLYLTLLVLSDSKLNPSGDCLSAEATCLQMSTWSAGNCDHHFSLFFSLPFPDSWMINGLILIWINLHHRQEKLTHIFFFF